MSRTTLTKLQWGYNNKFKGNKNEEPNPHRSILVRIADTSVPDNEVAWQPK
jgi:hypothetical protein